jgi:tyrosyl-tRNA synthetase
MSQSLGNYVAIREAPEEMFGKLMSIPDRVVARYAELATDLAPDEIAAIADAAVAGGPPAGDSKRRVARAIVALYHGDAAAAEAEQAFDRQFRAREAPQEIPEASIPPDAIDGDRVYLPRVLAELGLVASRSEARRMIAQQGVRIDGEVVSVEEIDLADLKGAVLQVGKRRFVRIVG